MYVQNCILFALILYCCHMPIFYVIFESTWGNFEKEYFEQYFASVEYSTIRVHKWLELATPLRPFPPPGRTLPGGGGVVIKINYIYTLNFFSLLFQIYALCLVIVSIWLVGARPLVAPPGPSLLPHTVKISCICLRR